MELQRSVPPAIEQEFIRRQVVSQLLQARLRATCGLTQTPTPLPLATSTGDRPPLRPLQEPRNTSVIEASQP
ncbi:hypothetical protein MZ909_05315 [Thermosynechococcus sp. B0]|uniref:hypothetical protein n=1 Tax=unclassified Thermosynechococcus TaxID=2622553 RepID=UPI002578182A|nr:MULTISPECIES: hypothetical protein [unclassified Thermosynechococcus]WJI25101.1 hypothetical protein MZ909_05315 [Thermosynechococcus sp. B0]WJI27629.1 hypothetical protein M0644_05380 [Thermosynechococcus sp. B1]WJI30161.1 hypothetical protein M0646_05385 [Thermosynechococcus sp. B3]